MGAAATAVVAGVFGHIGVASDQVVARATGQVDGTGRKPIRLKARPRPTAPAAGQPNDPLWSSSWSLTKVRAPGAWRLTTGAAETIVAVLDTGIDRDQADLQDPSSTAGTPSTRTPTRQTITDTARSLPASSPHARTTASAASVSARAAR